MSRPRKSRNVIPLRASDLSPEMVLETVQEDLPMLQEVFIVGIDISGAPVIYASGDFHDLPLAVLALQNLALRLMNGAIVDG